ncbi:MAG: AAA family ATPase [Bradymonadaceae bacterium]
MTIAPPIINSEVAFESIQRIRAEVGKVVIGQDDVIDLVLCAFLAGGHVLIEGVPGLGKTLLVLALSKTFGGRFQRVQFTPDLMPSDVTGHAMFDARTGEFQIRKGPVFTNILLADEINRAPAKTQAALLEVMQERQVSIEGTSFLLDPPFMTLATQNPIEQDGTYPLPEAQLDRFLFQIDIGYPEQNHERDIVESVTRNKLGDSLQIGDVQTLLSIEDARRLQMLSASILVDTRIVDYAVRITRATRQWPGISAGAGPRGGISLVRAARAFAVLQGRDHVIPDDVKFVALPCLRHRILLAPEVALDGIGADQILRDVLRKVEAPRS